ncbi:DUF4352 domain-containing protein [Streptomyces sp. NPDC005533]|uniref:DUF4352 domain-containing protein n=1 Tax=Streptomyces sp. NPDC005533 TaxID=3364723 RepID=UPI0036C3C624
MSTPNPPSTPPGPSEEPAGTPTAEAASIPAPSTQPLSLAKSPAAAAPEADAPPLSLEKPPAAAAPEAPAAPEPPADAVAPEAPAPADTPADPWATPAPADPWATPAPSAPQAPAAPAAPAAHGAPAAPAPSPFAPPAPAPGPPTGPGGPAPVWGAPPAWGQPGFGGVPYAGHPQGPPTTNGLALAAVIVAGFAIMTGLVPLFFWAGALLAIVATGLGIGALVRAGKGAPNKAMSVVGTVLGVLGLAASVGGFFLTAVFLDNASGRYEQGLDIDEEELDLEGLYPSGEPWPSASPSPSQVPGLTGALPFGETFTYPNGVKVSLSAPKKYVTKNTYSKVGNAVVMTLTITNGSSATHQVIYAMPTVRDEDGTTAKLVFDGDVPKMVTGDILPGESASGTVAFEVPEGTERVSAAISPGILLPDAKFSGPIG